MPRAAHVRLCVYNVKDDASAAATGYRMIERCVLNLTPSTTRKGHPFHVKVKGISAVPDDDFCNVKNVFQGLVERGILSFQGRKMEYIYNFTFTS